MIITDVQEGLDEGNYVLGVRASADDGDRGLIFIEAIPDDDEEMDSYCLVGDPSQAVFYGGVEECEIRAADGAGKTGVLHLVFDSEAADVLELPRSATFDLIISADQLDVLRKGLRRILTSGNSSQVSVLRGL